MATDYEDIGYRIDTGIATITLDRPAVYNAFTKQTITELNDAINQFRGDDNAHVAVLTGAGDGFCAGADVSSMPDWKEKGKRAYGEFLRDVQSVVANLRGSSKPTIAAVEGPAIGAGCDFALACDLRLVGPDAVLREGFVKMGLIPGDGGAWLLPRLIGEAKAREYLLTGKGITSAAAVDLGLAVEESENALNAAYDLAEEMLDLPALAVRHTNNLINPEQSFEAYCEQAIDHQWDCVNDPEHEEAVAAFREKREPEFDRTYN
ncbi:enoyl-CoA hydratase/isomerase family protein [Halococcus sediminicola]|uniref:enoyl-CoA hydratase/isomerase family protein n=1 Tax=Halococcus sediminicola TaxID=1264579 RepID=UPI0006799129|nr:enoyl-CoA hydratase/isomerase family protein [Halococcus sediminicola]